MSSIKFRTDYLENGFQYSDIPLKSDRDGTQHATLINRNSQQNSSKAVLYVHGFNDYFFQTELADKYNEQGINFFAVDLRKYGRSLLKHQHPNFTSDITEYFEEIDQSISIIKSLGNTSILLMGHSAGGLICSLYTHAWKEKIDGLILNSPFFDFNISPRLRFLKPFIVQFGTILPYLKIDSLDHHYPISLHKNHKGIWDFNLEWKPLKGFPTYLGWVRAMNIAQKQLQQGLEISCPVLILHSDKSFNASKWDESIRTSDAVLDVKHMKKYANKIGKNVSVIEIKDGIHDLVLSKKDIREKVYQSMFHWLKPFFLDQNLNKSPKKQV